MDLLLLCESNGKQITSINLPTVELHSGDKNSTNAEKVIAFCRPEEIAKRCYISTRKIASANLSLCKEIYYDDSQKRLQVYISEVKHTRKIQMR